MALPTVSYSLDTIAATTLQAIRPKLADNIFKANPLVFWLLANGRVQLEDSGKWIEEPLEYATNNTLDSYLGWEQLNVNATDEITAARFGWRQFAGAVAYSGLEDLMNAGRHQVINALKAKVRNLERSAKEYLNFRLLARDSGKDVNRDFLGLAQLLDTMTTNTAVTSWSTVGGINRTNETWWKNYWGGETTETSYYTLADVAKGLRRLIRMTGKGQTKIDLLLMNGDCFEAYEQQNADLLRMSDTRLLDVGFQNQMYKGVTMMWDEMFDDSNTGWTSGPSSHICFGLNSEFMRLVLHRRRNFSMTPFVRPYNQDGRVAQMLVAGNMTINNSRFQGAFVASS